MVIKGNCLPSVVGALLIVAEDGTSQTMKSAKSAHSCRQLVTTHLPTCTDITNSLLLSKHFSKIKNYKSRMVHTSIRTGAPQVTYFVDYTRENTI